MVQAAYADISVILNQTLSEKVADQLREAILSGQLKPGQHIVESDIVDVMKISRGPVRDALRTLETEHLVVRYPRRGTFVSHLEWRDAEEIYSLRQALEMVAVEYAVRQATEAQFDELDQLVTAMERQLQRRHTAFELADIDLDFHEALCKISGHTRVIAAWKNLRPQIRLSILTHRIPQAADSEESLVARHRHILAVLRQRDLVLAKQVFHEHLLESFEYTRSAIRNSQTPNDAPAAP